MLLAMATLGALSGCAASSLGTVTGGIQPCQALPAPGAPEYAAGTVTVLQGAISWRSTGAWDVRPGAAPRVVAQQQVPVDWRYSFSLKPGDEVLQAHYLPPAEIAPTVSITLHAGETLHADIPNQCI